MDTKHWKWSGKVWRLQVSVIIYRHRYRTHSDRWVVMPAIVYDRKES